MIKARICVLLMIMLGICPCHNLLAQERSSGNTDTSRDEEYNRIISELEARIEKLENNSAARGSRGQNRNRQGSQTPARNNSNSELEALLKAAQDMAPQKPEQEQTVPQVFRSEARQQQQLNPEISFTGDFAGISTTGKTDYFNELGDFNWGRNKFYFREAEFSVMAPLDPFTRGKFFFGIPGSGGATISTIVEEAYMEWLNLPGGVNLKVGKFNTQFGILNRWHDHGLPQYDRPRALTNLFGTGNFGGIGVGGNIVLPHLWAHVNELDLEIVSGGDGFSFEDHYKNVIGVAHLKNYYDISGNAYFEFGVSGAHGYSNVDKDYTTSLYGLDFTYKWVPIGRSRYRTTEIKSEFFLSEKEDVTGTKDGFGFYSYITNRVGPRSWIGLRYSYSDMPPDPNSATYTVLKDENEWDISPTFDFWQSEFVMLRLQYSFVKRSYGEDDNTLFVQTVWSMGPHKHEAY